MKRMMWLSLVMMLLSARVARAQDPSGHWVGSIQIPGREVAFAIDLARTAGGEMAGAISVDDADGVPLASVTVKGRSIAFYSRSDQPLTGTLSEDGARISGDATLSGYSLPFAMKRTGDARLLPPPLSDAVSRDLEGTWHGTLQANGLTLHALLTLTNQPGGKAIGRVVSVDEGGLTLPVVVVQRGSRVEFEQKGVPGSYSGELNAGGTELTGTFTQRGVSIPLTFTRAAR
jgi:hypothetical protein